MPPAPLRVLVVDDEPLIRDVLVACLEREGHTVDVAGNGQEALACIEQATPDLVVLDLAMPVMDGWTFLHERQASPTLQAIPVLVLSAAPVPEARQAKALGATAVLAKPFGMDVLTAAVHRLTRPHT